MMIDANLIEHDNAGRKTALMEDYDALGTQLARRGIDIEAITARAAAFAVALPSWGTGTGGTRFARFPGPGEPRHIFDKIDDCGVIHRLTAATPTISPKYLYDQLGSSLFTALTLLPGLGHLAHDRPTSTGWRLACGLRHRQRRDARCAAGR